MIRSIARRVKRAFWQSRLSSLILDRFIDCVQYQVLSPRTLCLVRMDALRLRARHSHPKENTVPAQIKLHAGCGSRLVEGWLNVDVAGGDQLVDLGCGVLPWKDGVFEAIVSQHVIEHLDLFDELLPLLAEFRRVIRTGGEIWLSCPDLEKACRSYLETGGNDMLVDFTTRFPKLAAWRDIPSHMINSLFHQDGEHKNLFDFDLLRWACEQAGFNKCERMQEDDLLRRFPEFPARGDDFHSLYVRAVVL